MPVVQGSGEKAGDAAAQWVDAQKSWVSARTQSCWRSLVTEVNYPSCCALLLPVSSGWCCAAGRRCTWGVKVARRQFALPWRAFALVACSPLPPLLPLKSRHWCATSFPSVWGFPKAKALLGQRGIQMQSWPIFTGLQVSSSWETICFCLINYFLGNKWQLFLFGLGNESIISEV